jgi:hypothetical protein
MELKTPKRIRRRERVAQERHGQSCTRTYRIWCGMKARCLNPAIPRFRTYGYRGIKVCERWMQFSAFLEDMGHAPDDMSIDRIDSNGDYCPENCRWADAVTQGSNRRDCRPVTMLGETKIVKAWSRDPRCAVKPLAFINRIQHGWEPLDAFQTPKMARPPARTSQQVSCVCGWEGRRVNGFTFYRHHSPEHRDGYGHCPKCGAEVRRGRQPHK